MAKKKRRHKVVLTNPNNPNDRIQIIYDNEGYRVQKVTISKKVADLDSITFNQNPNT